MAGEGRVIGDVALEYICHCPLSLPLPLSFSLLPNYDELSSFPLPHPSAMMFMDRVSETSELPPLNCFCQVFWSPWETANTSPHTQVLRLNSWELLLISSITSTSFFIVSTNKPYHHLLQTCSQSDHFLPFPLWPPWYKPVSSLPPMPVLLQQQQLTMDWKKLHHKLVVLSGWWYYQWFLIYLSPTSLYFP